MNIRTISAAAAALTITATAFAQAQQTPAMPQGMQLPQGMQQGMMEAAFAAMGQIATAQKEAESAEAALFAATDKASREAAWARYEAAEKKMMAVADMSAQMMGGMVDAGQVDMGKQMLYSQTADKLAAGLAKATDPEAKSFFEAKLKEYREKAGGEAKGAADPAALTAEDLKFTKWPGSKTGVMVSRNVAYGTRQVGKGAPAADVAQIYDLYIPGPVEKLEPKSKFFLYIHGGAWASGTKDWPTQIFVGLAARGYIVATMNYALNNPALGGVHSFADMLKDVDAMVSHVPVIAKALGVEIPRIAVGGSSAGGHLALLYGYDGANPEALGLGLAHAVPVACIFSDCGPTDLASPEFSVAGMNATKQAFAESCANFSTLLTGKPEYASLQALVKSSRAYSPAYLVNKKCPPTICLYGRNGKVPTTGMYKTSQADGQRKPYSNLWKEIGSTAKVPVSVATDGIVAVQNFVLLTNRLHKASVPYAAKLAPHGHTMILQLDPSSRTWLYKNLDKYMAAPAATAAPAK